MKARTFAGWLSGFLYILFFALLHVHAFFDLIASVLILAQMWQAAFLILMSLDEKR